MNKQNTILVFQGNLDAIDLSKVYRVTPKNSLSYEVWFVGCSEPLEVYDEYLSDEYPYLKREELIRLWDESKKNPSASEFQKVYI